MRDQISFPKCALMSCSSAHAYRSVRSVAERLRTHKLPIQSSSQETVVYSEVGGENTTG